MGDLIMKKLLALTLSVCFAQGVMAQFMDGTKLRQLSEANARMTGTNFFQQDPADSARFLGYLHGAADAEIYVTHCPPPGFSGTQLIGVVNKYMANNPELWNMSGALIVKIALAKAFPCKK
jgi:hypothetical protein